MRPLTRTTVGAALGSLLVLFIHPISRPFAMGGITQYGPSSSIESSPLLSESFEVLPQPKTVIEASIWMEEGADRLNRRSYISKNTLLSLIRIAKSASSREPNNSFWLQMAAVFSTAHGELLEAADLWKSAARCTSWNDHQSSRFESAKTAMSIEEGSRMAWQSAAFYYRRSKECAFAIHRFGRTQLSGVGVKTAGDLSRRMDSLRNGVLLRDNSRSIDVGLYGVDIVESASTESRTVGATPRKLITARYAFIDNLRAVGMEADVKTADSAFLDNDGWLALLLKESPAESMREWSGASILTAAMPGCLLVVALVGYFFAGLGVLLVRNPKFAMFVRAPVAPMFGFALSIVAYLATGLALFSLAIAACFAFLAIVPIKERTQPPQSFGPLFDFAIGAMAFLFSGFILAFLIGVTTPALEIAPFLSLPDEYYGGQTLPIGLAVLVLSLIFLIAPLWALTQRISTAHVVCIAIRNFGFDVAVLCSFLGIVCIPIAIFFDMRLEPVMASALMNEPTYYLTR